MICQRLQIPLEKAGIDCSVIQEEWDGLVEYGRKYLNLVQEDYKVIWWKLFNAVYDNKWSYVLAVIELLFSFLCQMGDTVNLTAHGS